jgi:SAM-dependent methyltransferase
VSNACRPENTAIPRTQRSAPARAVAEILAPALGVQTLLDYGCGRGIDVDWYRQRGLQAEGFDPHAPFGFDRPPSATFDLVTCVYVLNVLDDPRARREVLLSAQSFARPGGAVLVVTRAAASIEREAAKRGWPRHHDGWWSNRARGMFQHGLTRDEIIALGREAGHEAHDIAPPLKLDSDTTWALLVRAGSHASRVATQSSSGSR